MKNGSIQNRARGFSLIEVVIAILILTVALLSLAQVMAVATRTNYLAGRVTSASSIAKAQLERIKAMPFYTTIPGGSLLQPNPLLVAGGSLEQNLAGYREFYDPDGQVAVAGDALYVVRWQIDNLAVANAGKTMVLQMKRITVRCLPTAEVGNQFRTIGDAVFVTYRTANMTI